MTPQADITRGDLRLAPFDTERARSLCLFVALATLVFFAGYVYGALDQARAEGNPAVANDFRVFWAAGKLALAGTPLDVFDNAKLAAVHATETHRWMPWLYPPGYLLAVTPLGALPYAVGWIGFSLMSLVVLGWAYRPFVATVPALWLGLTLAPTCLAALFTGQNSLLWLAAMLATLAALRAERWVLAGIIIGLMTLKPQLGLLIPVALLAMGAWRTIATATATAAVLAIGPTLIYGADYWWKLKDMMAAHGARVFQAIDSVPAMVSPFSLLTSLGLNPALALNLQWALTLALIVIVFLCWRTPRCSFDLKAAVLLMATALATPYFWVYENACLAAVALFMLRAGVLDGRPAGLALFGLLCAGSGLTTVVNTIFASENTIPARYLITPVMLFAMFLCARAVLRDMQASTPAPETRARPEPEQ
ncbi:glycosyltransferase family 87 protein [Actibacterium ureilyticum]|uniref:glycosyltransferase family 87 protein n=1 Tax=Actibacterium ureilyticum TaxID=1590614 RepID=UPI0015950EBF|nr:glycosyltransferase family 87 protein [Actibacterium ureilyticum]